MNDIDRATLIGMIIGDGNLYIAKVSKKSKCGTLMRDSTISRLTFHHSKKQIEYLEHKLKLICKIFGGKVPTINVHIQSLKVTGKEYEMCSATKSHKYFRFLHKLIYSNNGKKYYTRQFLDMLTPLGIAIWYMDDGYKSFHKNKDGNITSGSTVISTYCTKEEAEIVCQYFKEIWDIEFKLAYHSTCKSYCVRANTKNSRKFVELIRQYIVPSMQYKIAHVPII